MSLPLSITAVCQDLRSRPWRDADEEMGADYVMQTELGELVLAFQTDSPEQACSRLAWLSMFAARRALPCWELYCDDSAPHTAVLAIRNWLLNGIEPQSWKPFMKAARPAYKGKRIVDCRASDTGCAAESAAQAARFVSTRNLVHAVSALSAAYMAFDQSPLGQREAFDRWLLEVAVPAAFYTRELTAEEQVAFRDIGIS